MNLRKLNYKKSGVDVEKAETIVSYIKKKFPSIGGYAGVFPFGKRKLTATTDGVGTKIKLAIEFNKHEVVGEDLVAMCVNDLIAGGSKPLFFLDYFACGKLDKNVFKRVLRGIEKGLKKVNSTLIGGEIAEMPGMYRKNEYDLAGFSCGVLVKEFKKEKIKKDDLIIGLKSSGIHSNGFSLVRKIFSKYEIKKYLNLIMRPTKIYSLFTVHCSLFTKIKNISHVTGGGIVRAEKRLLTEGKKIEFFKYDLPLIFKIIHKKGISLEEMKNTFNMGWGMIAVVSEKNASFILKETKGKVIGRVIAKG